MKAARSRGKASHPPRAADGTVAPASTDTSAPPRPARAKGRAPAWAGPLAIVLVGAAMAAWTWRRWPDPQVDFGRELYVAWRLSQGALLYVDVHYWNGPISPWLNAAWFKLAGVHLMTLTFVNLGLLAVAATLLYRLMSAVASRFAAAAGGVVFMTLFAFPQFVDIGNYNWVTPYSHEMTHGIIAGLVGLTCLGAWLRTGRRSLLLAVGGAAGVALLTKVEVSLAVFVAMALGLVAALWWQRAPLRRAAMDVIVAAIGFLLPPLVAWAALCTYLPAGTAFAKLLGSWTVMLTTDPLEMANMRRNAGLDDLGARLAVTVSAFVSMAVLAGGCALVGVFARTGRRARPMSRRAAWRAPVLTFAAVLLLMWAGRGALDWISLWRGLPIAMLLLAGWTAHRLVRQRRHGPLDPTLPLRFALLLFAGALLLKMALRTRIHQYGFGLALPATLVLVAVLLAWLPAAVSARGGNARLVQAAAAAALVACIGAHLEIVAPVLAEKNIVVSEGADAFRAGTRGPVIRDALEEVKARVAPDQTLAVLPEGVMLNYLARRRSSVPFVNYVPFELVIAGEERVEQAFAAHPPDFIAVMHRNTQEHGFRFFGQDYGQDLMRWVEANYRPVRLIGSPPLKDGRFGVQLMEHVSLPVEARSEAPAAP